MAVQFLEDFMGLCSCAFYRVIGRLGLELSWILGKIACALKPVNSEPAKSSNLKS
jgi:hypothetical protein